jgi:hypothetical protein
MSSFEFNKQEQKKGSKEKMNEPIEENVEQKIESAEKQDDIPVQPERQDVRNIVVHSEVDVMLLDRLKSQPKTLKEVDDEVIVQPKEGRHQLSLPDELDPYLGKYAFCWIFKRKKAIDEAYDLYHYKLVNQTLLNNPPLPDHLFSARGIIERGDNVLMFRSKKIDEEMRKIPGIESLRNIKARNEAHEGAPNFYIPESEEKTEKIVGV